MPIGPKQPLDLTNPEVAEKYISRSLTAGMDKPGVSHLGNKSYIDKHGNVKSGKTYVGKFIKNITSKITTTLSQIDGLFREHRWINDKDVQTALTNKISLLEKQLDARSDHLKDLPDNEKLEQEQIQIILLAQVKEATSQMEKVCKKLKKSDDNASIREVDKELKALEKKADDTIKSLTEKKVGFVKDVAIPIKPTATSHTQHPSKPKSVVVKNQPLPEPKVTSHAQSGSKSQSGRHEDLSLPKAINEKTNFKNVKTDLIKGKAERPSQAQVKNVTHQAKNEPVPTRTKSGEINAGKIQISEKYTKKLAVTYNEDPVHKLIQKKFIEDHTKLREAGLQIIPYKEAPKIPQTPLRSALDPTVKNEGPSHSQQLSAKLKAHVKGAKAQEVEDDKQKFKELKKEARLEMLDDEAFEATTLSMEFNAEVANDLKQTLDNLIKQMKADKMISGETENKLNELSKTNDLSQTKEILDVIKTELLSEYNAEERIGSPGGIFILGWYPEVRKYFADATKLNDFILTVEDRRAANPDERMKLKLVSDLSKNLSKVIDDALKNPEFKEDLGLYSEQPLAEMQKYFADLTEKSSKVKYSELQEIAQSIPTEEFNENVRFTLDLIRNGFESIEKELPKSLLTLNEKNVLESLSKLEEKLIKTAEKKVKIAENTAKFNRGFPSKPRENIVSHLAEKPSQLRPEMKIGKNKNISEAESTVAIDDEFDPIESRDQWTQGMALKLQSKLKEAYSLASSFSSEKMDARLEKLVKDKNYVLSDTNDAHKIIDNSKQAVSLIRDALGAFIDDKKYSHAKLQELRKVLVEVDSLGRLMTPTTRKVKTPEGFQIPNPLIGKQKYDKIAKETAQVSDMIKTKISSQISDLIDAVFEGEEQGVLSSILGNNSEELREIQKGLNASFKEQTPTQLAHIESEVQRLVLSEYARREEPLPDAIAKRFNAITTEVNKFSIEKKADPAVFLKEKENLHASNQEKRKLKVGREISKIIDEALELEGVDEFNNHSLLDIQKELKDIKTLNQEEILEMVIEVGELIDERLPDGMPMQMADRFTKLASTIKKIK